MTHTHRKTRLAFALVVATASVGPSLGAQVTEVARRPISDIAHLTFGSLCEDKFVIRNDGPNPVNVEYAVEKGTEHTRLTLAGREQVELESKSREALELWMDGKLVAKAEKEGRKCRDVQGNASVAVAPLEVASTERSDDNRRGNMRAGVGVGYGYPFYDPWYGPYGAYGWGYRPFYSGFYGVPIIIGGRGRRR
ncbi:MAG: hypothetical protein H7099_08040 [Gemmatimonadaceae bacterium]|nr:hypothetical protein [Gemmatimonadaceae bacterium]